MHRFTSAALNELRLAVFYYENQEAGLGAALLDEVEKAVGRILAAPEAWKRLSPRTRRCLIHRFPYGLLYQIRSEEILIVSVMNLRRNPESWKNHH